MPVSFVKSRKDLRIDIVGPVIDPHFLALSKRGLADERGRNRKIERGAKHRFSEPQHPNFLPRTRSSRRLIAPARGFPRPTAITNVDHSAHIASEAQLAAREMMPRRRAGPPLCDLRILRSFSIYDDNAPCPYGLWLARPTVLISRPPGSRIVRDVALRSAILLQPAC